MRSLSWFELGVRALKRACPGRPCYGYVCPLCLRLFPREHAHMLTREHAPPKKLGGRAIILTCRECNSRAGGKLDDEMLAQEQQLDFLLGTMPGPLPSRLQTPGANLNVEVHRSGDATLVYGLPRQNNPEAQAAWEEELQQLASRGGADGYTSSLSLKRRFHSRPAHVGWLRAAYLVAFAAFGYRYILSSALTIVRDQLDDISAGLIPVFSLIDPEADRAERHVLVVDTPETLSQCVSVQMGRHTVLLPGQGQDTSFYQRLAELRHRGGDEQLTLFGTQLPWPTGPVFALDLQHGG